MTSVAQKDFSYYAFTPKRRVLHVGCGPYSPHRLHPIFRNRDEWSEVRLDVNADVNPEILCSTADMSAVVATGSFQALWSSHNIEHLCDHEIMPAFSEFRRVLAPGGFALLRCPDLDAVVEAIVATGDAETVAYMSPAGPITPLDMLFGHRASVARGNLHMAHKTAFTDRRLGRMLLEAGFSGVYTKRATGFDLWAVAFTDDESIPHVLAELARDGLDFRQ